MTLYIADVNVLVAALHPQARGHERQRAWLHGVLNGGGELAVAPATLVGTIRVATNPRIFDPPADREVATNFTTTLRRAPGVRQLIGNDRVWEAFEGLLLDDPQARGNLVPDAWLAALAITYGARLATMDRGMARWPRLDWFDPIDT